LGTDSLWILGGRDESELIVVMGRSGKTAGSSLWAGEAVMSLINDCKNFYTIVYSSLFFKLEYLESHMGKMYNTLDRQTVIGESQILPDAAVPIGGTGEPPILSSALENKIAFLVSSRSMRNLKNELVKLFEDWEKERRTQVWVEKILRRIFNIVEKNVLNLSCDICLKLEKQFEEALCFSTNLEGLLKCVWDIIEDMISVSDSGRFSEKTNVISLLDKIEKHIEKNLSEPITLHGICDEFGVSQPYLSRIFRKYKNMSFVEFITNARINEAKRLMLENRDMHLKDIAAIVGYSDPNYFSRIFKAVTGLPPSGFMN
jgi:AraC-like DNA-binding protein